MSRSPLPTLYDRDIPADALGARRIGILGFGSQGQAHALNLRDGGHAVRIGLPPASRSRARATELGFDVDTPAAITADSDVVMVLAPDELQAALYAGTPQAGYQDAIAPHLRPGAALAFAHGFAIHHRLIVPPDGVDVIMAAPMGAGPLVRREFERDRGVSCLVAVHADATGNARAIALGYARALGGGRIGILETTFAEETETDLFAEQAVLCGGVSALIRAAFETLVEAGYPEELAYFSCLHELKFTVDLMHERGLAGMRSRISNTAKYGDLTRGPRVIGDAKPRLAAILHEIQSQAFGREWIAEAESGRARLDALMREGEAHPIEAVGARLRGMMADPKG